MDIKKINENKEVTLKLSGWLDTQSAPELGKEIEALEDFNKLVLDFDELEYISSSGLRQVVAGYKKAKAENAEYLIINVCAEIMDVIHLTGLDGKFNISAKQ